MHGMGAKRPLDSIGSGPVVAWRFPRGPDTVQPPLLPDHQLRLLNWSRTSRRLASSALWFAALPYSLINVAGQTADAKNGVAKDAATVTLVSVVHIVGLVVTLSGLLWLPVLSITCAGQHRQPQNVLDGGFTAKQRRVSAPSDTAGKRARTEDGATLSA